MRRSKKVLLAVGFVFIVVIAGLVLAYGVEAWVRKTDPLRDVPSAEFQKTASKTRAIIGDTFTVEVFVGWHGHVLPEWTRHVRVFDPYPEDYLSSRAETTPTNTMVMDPAQHSLIRSPLWEALAR